MQASSVADLSWQTSGSYDFYLVYRNGKPIAKLTQTQYTDELSSGSTTYQVRGCYADSSNYGLSSAVTVDVRAKVHQVSDLGTGQTLLLPYSDSQHRQTTRTLSRQVELLQLSGAYYPVAVEVDSGTDSLSITAALLDESEIRQLMGLVGKIGVVHKCSAEASHDVSGRVDEHVRRGILQPAQLRKLRAAPQHVHAVRYPVRHSVTSSS